VSKFTIGKAKTISVQGAQANINLLEIIFHVLSITAQKYLFASAVQTQLAKHVKLDIQNRILLA
jgi:hypothetical protein